MQNTQGLGPVVSCEAEVGWKPSKIRKTAPVQYGEASSKACFFSANGLTQLSSAY